MPDLQQIRNFNLKIIFLTHFLFISLSSMGFWNTSAYLFYNSLLIVLLLWSIYQDQSLEPIQMAIVVNGSSIILDIFLLIMCFPNSPLARERFSAAMAILHLIVRPFSIFILVKNLEERSGSTGVLSGILSPAGRNDSYEDMDRENSQQPSNPATGYDFSSAQAI